jgi:hypothetical protein
MKEENERQKWTDRQTDIATKLSHHNEMEKYEGTGLSSEINRISYGTTKSA